MTDYLSRLIHMSGLAIKPTQDRGALHAEQPADLVPSDAATDGDANPPSPPEEYIEYETHETIKPPAASRVPPPGKQQHPINEFVPIRPEQISQSESKKLLLGTDETKPIIQAQGELRQAAIDSAEQGVAIPDSAKPMTPKQMRVEHAFTAKKPAERTRRAVDEKPRGDGFGSSLEMTINVDRESASDMSVYSESSTKNQSDMRPAEEPTIKDVREWVSAVTASGPDEILPLGVEEEEITVGEKSGDRDPNDLFEILSSQSLESRPRMDSAKSDFHLSIGTISITVEAPSVSTPASQQLPAPAPAPVGREYSTRLSRHYLRMT